MQSSPLTAGAPVSILPWQPALCCPIRTMCRHIFYNTHLLSYTGGTPSHPTGVTNQQESDQSTSRGAILNPKAAPFIPRLRPQESPRNPSVTPFTSAAGGKGQDDAPVGRHANPLLPSRQHAGATSSPNTSIVRREFFGVVIASREACTSDRARAGHDATRNDSQGIFTLEDIGVNGLVRTTSGD
jgi:hypothetical protein